MSENEQSPAGPTPIPTGLARLPRKRAPRACAKCRKRKVRCDVTRVFPCTNCRLDGLDCMVSLNGLFYPRSFEQHTASLIHGNPVDQSPPDANCLETVVATSSEDGGRRTNPPKSDLAEDTSHTPNHVTNGNFEATMAALGSEKSFAMRESSVDYMRYSVDILFSSIPFLSAPAVDAGNLGLFNSPDCLRIPAAFVLDDFIRKYFLYVHPILPLLNEGDFWKIYEAQPGNLTSSLPPPVSLLLLQSMMFASCPFVTQESIAALGFYSIQQARLSFYMKAKILYDHKTDPNPLSVAQAALLLADWTETKWLGVAICNAKIAGADKYNTAIGTKYPTPKHNRRQNILKRVWWCCIIQDRIMSLCARRKMQIGREQFNSEPNTPLDYGDLMDEIDGSKVYDATSKRFLIQMLQQLAQFCLYLADILALVYPIKDAPNHDNELNDRLLQTQQLRRGLHCWSKLSMEPLSPVDLPFASKASNEAIVLFTNLLCIYHQSARVALGNYDLYLVLTAGLTNQNAETSNNLRCVNGMLAELESALASTTDCLKRLKPLKLACRLPSSIVACLTLPLASSLLDIKLFLAFCHGTQYSPQMAKKKCRLDTLRWVLSELRPRYHGVESALTLVQHLMECVSPARTTGGVPTKGHRDGLGTDPCCYLVLAMFLDLGLDRSRLPQEREVSSTLRELASRAGFFNYQKGLNRRDTDALSALPELSFHNLSKWFGIGQRTQLRSGLRSPRNRSLEESVTDSDESLVGSEDSGRCYTQVEGRLPSDPEQLLRAVTDWIGIDQLLDFS
ncbi:hypothetical protein LCI18_006748 [Fusarium solani-melongenae]|uniref:Uncharacterized protein n=1 Tax=Fusarium solani subsp. cucurbitae TaxID=2747967 RepID=A0ACD3Z3H1_FUSSC|nr:hypothetical protein LCI18_006748 [Fusarium solani-melongenae]